MKTGKLEVLLPSDNEIRFARVFDAPPELVFAAHTKPDRVRHWLFGPPEWPLTEVDIDLRIGGRFRYVWHNEERGKDMVLRGVYKEIVVPERIVHTEIFDEDWTGGETLVTTGFNERDGCTFFTVDIRYSSKEARDGALKTGMTDGMEQAYVRLDEMLAPS